MHNGQGEGTVQEAPNIHPHQHFPHAIFKHFYWEVALSTPILVPCLDPCAPCSPSCALAVPQRGDGLVRLERRSRDTPH